MTEVFTRILRIDLPETLHCDESGKNPAFSISFVTDGEVPFPQLILHAPDGQHLCKDAAIQASVGTGGEYIYTASIPAGSLRPGEIQVQAEGCRKADLNQAGGGDWIKSFGQLRLAPRAKPAPALRVASGSGDTAVKLYFGIHKHMHQPYYNAVDQRYWDGEKDSIFGARGGPYTHFIPTAVRQYAGGGLPHAGLSTSWSGSLIEQLDRCAAEGLCGCLLYTSL